MTTKHDDGKARWHLVPVEAMEEVVRVLDYGARKYAPDNWRTVPEAHDRYCSAALRHLVAHRKHMRGNGPAHDTESGLSHLAHALCCLLFLLQFEMERAR